ncbi:RNase H domain-containing protein [Aphis craccivora]|uniref:RNase H domain-containing protein n=1 Tax=Aphis craccivora TaxID=307492 RepID=A0A6G0ZD11_APHCR|nr:RNase H domain-containing protein [Aphis craccivora]
MWVPSHIGISGNEMADKSADIATKTILHPTITDIPAKDINKSIRNKINMTWQSYWDSVPPTNKLKKIKRFTKK